MKEIFSSTFQSIYQSEGGEITISRVFSDDCIHIDNVDHPDYFKMLNCDTDRLIVLCWECHLKEHKEIKNVCKEK